MNYTEQISRNASFVSDLLSSDVGIAKQASNDLNKWLVTYQRQDGVFRQWLTPEPVTEAEFAESATSRDPHIIRSIKPRSAGAMTTNFDTGTISTGMWADKYTIYLHRAWTPKYRIDKAYLAAYKGDLLGMIKDLSLQDLLAVEDVEGISLMNANAGQKNVVNNDIQICQYVDCGVKVTPDSINHLVSGLTLSTDNMTPAKGLVHRYMWFRLVTALKADQVGDNVAEQALMGNVRALEESLLGIKWLTILDRNLIGLNTAYVTADAEYCGNFVTWGDALISTEVKDQYWVEMFASEQYGISLPYKGCLVRGDWGAPATDWTTGQAIDEVTE